MGTDVQAEQGQVTKEGKSFQRKLFLSIYLLMQFVNVSAYKLITFNDILST